MLMVLFQVKKKVTTYFKHKRNRRAVIFLTALLVFLYYPLKKPLIRDDYSRIITDRNDEILRVFLTTDQQYCLPPEFIDSVPEKLQEAVIHFEDKYFYYHPGINPVSLTRAIIQNIKSRKVVSGASTLTMQLARIRKGRKRTASNKFVEMLEALRIEAQYSKKEILNLYLNHAPYGGNIIGYQAASWRYFGKPPQKLSWAEACLLAVLPNSPGTISPVKNNEQLLRKRDDLLNSLYENGKIDKSTLNNSLEEPMPDRIRPFDLRVPHLTRKIHSELSGKINVVKTSIDSEIQDKVKSYVGRYSRMLKNYDIKNAAVLVVENKSRKVRAYVGSQDFYGEEGRVDGVIAPRSSGSLLKPFLYALSIQEGLIIPNSLLQDIPTYYGTFSPHNASEMYDGIVTAHDALVRSLNVPAVRLLYTYGHYKFYNFLSEANLSTLYRSADDYGLPMIIGGTEVTLWDMANSYCSLANLGSYGSISYLENQNDNINNTYNLIDSVSVALTLNMLKDLKRPGSEYYWNKFNSQRPVAWKTGTSYGHKDAWAVGVNPDWTIAVWIGNFDASTNKNLSGAKSAGPLLFDIFNSLPILSETNWWQLEDFVTETAEVCAITGYAATSRCEETKLVPVAHKDILKACPYHIKVFVDTNTNYAVCSKCWDHGYAEKKMVTYPPLVINYLRKNGSVVEKIPVHNPLCEVHRNNQLMSIEYPKPNSKIFVTRDFDGEYQSIVCSAVHQLKNQILYWYLDEKYLGQTNGKHKIDFIPDPGEHTLTVIDAFGNTQVVNFFSTNR
jgi:penicillin-binding protein 1C